MSYGRTGEGVDKISLAYARLDVPGFEVERCSMQDAGRRA